MGIGDRRRLVCVSLEPVPKWQFSGRDLGGFVQMIVLIGKLKPRMDANFQRVPSINSFTVLMNDTNFTTVSFLESDSRSFAVSRIIGSPFSSSLP